MCPTGPVQVATALLEYCLADADASADGAAPQQLAGLHIVPLLSGEVAALQPDQAAAGAPRLYLPTAVQQRVLASQAHLLLQCEVWCCLSFTNVLPEYSDLHELHCRPCVVI